MTRASAGGTVLVSCVLAGGKMLDSLNKAFLIEKESL